MNKDHILHIIISFLVIVALWSYYLWKMTVYNNLEIENKQELNYVNIWSINVIEFKEKMNQDYIVIDIRTLQEVEAWRIESMDLNIDYYKDNFKSELEKLDKTKNYLIYCRSGSRTWNTLNLMKNIWFIEVHDLAWWIWSWERAGEQFVK